ncbi:MAG: flagellar hook-length control protein FliK [Spirochaetales bacterium]
MSLALPHFDAGKALTKNAPSKNALSGVPAPSAGAAPKAGESFEAKLKALTAKKPVTETPKTEVKPSDKPLVPQAAPAKVAPKQTAAPEAVPAKAEKKADPKEKKAVGESEAALALLVAHPAQPTQAAPSNTATPGLSSAKAAKEDSPNEAAERAKVKVATKPAAEKPTSDKAPGAELRFDTLVKAEAKKAEKDDAKPKITVVDKRTDKDKAKRADAEGEANSPTIAQVTVSAAKTTETKPVDGVQVVFQTVTGKGQGNNDVQPKNTPVAPQDAAAFQKFLVEKGYGQLVEQARIILKNDNQGEIHMTLYPETLGKIKVALNLNDTHLAGEIFVENQTVKEILQDNMGQLLQSFREGGFGDMNIQVSVGNGQQGQTQDRQGRSAAQAATYGKNVAVDSGEFAAANRISAWTDRQVNLTA